MTLADWVVETGQMVREDGMDGVLRSALKFQHGALRRLEWIREIERTTIWEKEWDVLLVADACRFDLMEEVAPQYDWVGTPEPYMSVGSSTSKWCQNTFNEGTAAEMSDVIYVCGNPVASRNIENEDDFFEMHHVWEETWDADVGTIHPDRLVDYTVLKRREHPGKRIITHFMQPHHPFVPDPLSHSDGMYRDGWHNRDPWDLLRWRKISKADVWERYRKNLEYFLDCLVDLRSSVDGDVVVTSDHGNEMGRFLVYGHPPGVPLKGLLKVPWCRIETEDTGEYEPVLSIDESGPHVQQKLSDLGYR